MLKESSDAICPDRDPTAATPPPTRDYLRVGERVKECEVREFI